MKERAFANDYANPGGAKDVGAHTLRQYQGHIRRDEGGEMTPTPELMADLGYRPLKEFYISE